MTFLETCERHATEDPDWRVYGSNLAAEASHMGEQYTDARRLLLASWDGWASGEPGKDIIAREFLSTVWALAMSTGINGLGEPLEAFAEAVFARATE